MDTQTGLGQAGDVSIEDLYLISGGGTYLFVLDYLVELNIYEDIFSNFLTGSMMLSDSANIIKSLPIIGEEYLMVKITTPSFPTSIHKTFRVYAVTNRNIVTDNGTQTYILHFCSNEGINDTSTPIFKNFNGKINDVVTNIFDNYIKTNRRYIIGTTGLKEDDFKTQLTVLNPTDNNVKFVSTGWSPFKCINWLSNKSMPSVGKACNYLFWETSQQFYFGNMETIFSASQDENSPVNLGTYNYTPPSTQPENDINAKMFLIEDIEISKTADYMISNNNGYLSSRTITLNLFNKKYDIIDYSHIDTFGDYTHLAKKGSDIPIFSTKAQRTPETNIFVHPTHPNLFTGFKDNTNELTGKYYGNRLSHMLELSNFKLNISIPGRTDVEAGGIINLKFPDVRPPSDADKSAGKYDDRYSGNYLITAIRHKITILRHTMTLEIVKDSLEDKGN
jgi:hypothetical protein